MSGTVLARPVARRARKTSVGWLTWLASMLHAIETRRRLAEMDERMLKDIGVTRSEALEEANRAPWNLGPTAPHAPWFWR